jgi:hypothetical protein
MLKPVGINGLNQTLRQSLQKNLQFGQDYLEAERRRYAQMANAESLVEVARAEKKQVAYRVAHAEIPSFDAMPSRFNELEARFFAKKVFGSKTETPFTGLDLLQCLSPVKPYSVYAQPSIKNLSVFDLSQRGLPEKTLQTFSKQYDVTSWEVQDALKAAMRQGLVYEIRDTQRGATYYGATLEAVQTLELKPPVLKIETPQNQSDANTTEEKTHGLLQEPLRQVFTWVQKLMNQAENTKYGLGAELAEYTAQLVKALEHDHLLAKTDVPDSLQAAADSASEEAISGTLINMLEATEGSNGQTYVKSLCKQAAEIGLLDKKDLTLVA